MKRTSISFKHAPRKIIFIFLVVLLFVGKSFACPPVHKIPDYNCDGELVIAFIGDSLVFGTGDTKNGGEGGYVLRATQKFPDATLLNFGVPGQQTRELLQELDDAFSAKGKNALKNGLRRADIIVLDEGRNDRWLFGTPLATFRNIKRARKKITAEVKALGEPTPFIITAVLMLPNRGSQGPWVAELNEIIRKRNNKKFPSNLRFDKVSKSLLSDDQIHPTSAGYSQLTKKLVSYLKRRARKAMNKKRPDSDKDNLQDIFEETKFMTDPQNPDTDGDGVNDGEELFTFMTDPLSATEEGAEEGEETS